MVKKGILQSELTLSGLLEVLLYKTTCSNICEASSHANLLEQWCVDVVWQDIVTIENDIL